jgi:LysM repeat protein
VTKIAAYYRELCGPEKSPTPMPAPAGRVYVVKPGDVLWKIARRYGTTVQGLAARNNLADPNLILPGQELTIP